MHQNEKLNTSNLGRNQRQLTKEIQEILRNSLVAIFDESKENSFTFRFPSGETFELQLTRTH